jgi:hypothetical protein
VHTPNAPAIASEQQRPGRRPPGDPCTSPSPPGNHSRSPLATRSVSQARPRPRASSSAFVQQQEAAACGARRAWSWAPKTHRLERVPSDGGTPVFVRGRAAPHRQQQRWHGECGAVFGAFVSGGVAHATCRPRHAATEGVLHAFRHTTNSLRTRSSCSSMLYAPNPSTCTQRARSMRVWSITCHAAGAAAHPSGAVACLCIEHSPLRGGLQACVCASHCLRGCKGC